MAPPEPGYRLLVGDVREQLATLPDDSADCVVTSPPYWGLRDYGVDGQIGLEQSFDEYVSTLVDVFREVRRVLAPHGTCWLNLGDSYAANRTYQVTDSKHRDVGNTSAASVPEGLKPKDLVGQPWAVAKALRDPYYTGRIRDERDRWWLAAILDSEGCIHIHRRKSGTDSGAKFTKADGETVSYARTKDTYGVMVSIDNTSRALVDRCHEIIGQGSRYVHEAGAGKQNRKQTLYRLTLTGQQSRELLRELYPHLVAKQHEARIAYHSPSSGDGAAACHEAIKALHNGQETTLDRPEPPTLFEPGWYLRSAVIWGKSNPMPESVTDRPTTAHEYVFLLTRQPRYFYDAEAVREPAQFFGPNGSPETMDGALNARRGEMKGRAGGGRQARRYDARGFKTTDERNTRYQGPDPGDLKRNLRSVWTIPTFPYPEAHFATYPPALVERCLRAGCAREVCRTCGKARERIVERVDQGWDGSRYGERAVAATGGAKSGGTARSTLGSSGGALTGKTETLGFTDCGHDDYRRGVVLDPFAGSGTTLVVARRLGLDSIGIELNPGYAALIERRMARWWEEPKRGREQVDDGQLTFGGVE